MKKLFLLFLLLPLLGSAQTLLVGGEAGFKLPLGFSAGAGLEYRTQQWLRHTDQWSAEASVGYKPLKFLKIGLSYKFIQAQSLESVTSNGYTLPAYWNNRHRLGAGVTLTWKPTKKWSLSLRERYQFTARPSFLVPQFTHTDAPWGNKTVSSKHQHLLRTRLQAEFKPRKKSRFTPFASFELYSRLKEENLTKSTNLGGRFCEKFRACVGTEFKISKQNSLELFYRYAHDLDIDDNDSPNTIGLVYSFSL